MLPILRAEPTLFDGGGKAAGSTSSRSVTLSSPLTSESDVDDLVDLLYEVDIYRRQLKIESGDLQPGDTWRGMQSKMSVTAPGKKIRKRPENKPQSQINKCNNEKRRRELENETINQLEELLGTCLAEVKQPDKNGIVREATRKIQEVLRRHRECPHECPARRSPSASPVQAGEVSSTQQTPSSSVKFTEITDVIETLKSYTSALGWVLLEINNKGEIECVTDNIKDLIFYDRSDLYKKPIFSVLHTCDHSKIKSVLRKVQSCGWAAADFDKFQVINARLLTKGFAATDNTGYAEVLIHAAPVHGSSPEEAGSVMCVIRRCDDASAALLPVDGGPPAIPPAHKQPDQITFRLDCNYTVLTCDLSGIEGSVSLSAALVGTRILDHVEPSDQLRFEAHLRDAVCPPAPPAVSDPFRLRVAPDKPWIRLRAHSRLFRANPTTGEVDFIMSTHTILTDEEVGLLEPNANPSPIGGPLMPSAANGESSTSDSRYPSASPADHSQIPIDFDLDNCWGPAFPFSDMTDDWKEKRQVNLSEGPLTPRTSQTPSDNTPGPPQAEPNRLRTLLSKKPSSSDGDGTAAKNRILKDLLKQEDDEASSSETSAPHTPHTPLTPHTPHTPHTPAGAAAALSPLHSSQAHARPPPLPQAQPPLPPSSVQQVHHNNSDMLLKLLNEKSDEDSEEGRRGCSEGGRAVAQQSALLTQLLSNSNGPSSNGRSQDSSDTYLERLSGVKRKFEEPKGQAQNVKRATPELQQVTSSAISVASSSTQSSGASSPATSSAGMSSLCQRNQILVSLLARQQPHPTTPLPLPNPILRAMTPCPRPSQQPVKRLHSPLSNMLTHSRPNLNGGPSIGMETGGGAAQSHLQMVLQGSPRAYPSPSAPHYANTAPHHPYQKPQMPTSNTRTPGGGSNAGGGSGGDSEVPNDQALSDLLDEVIENMPDSDRSGSDVVTMMGMDANRQIRTELMGSKEENAMINAIRQSLMQCEKDTKNSPNPGAPPVYPVHSPRGQAVCNIPGAPGLYSMGVSRSTDSPAMAVPGGGGGGVVPSGADGARALVIAEQQRARLLQLQRSQQMLVSPEAAEQPQSDLGSTINALVSATPPNVSLSRTDYHHLYHPANQIGSTYGTNKIATPQQNPMLSRQLSGGYSSVSSGGAGAGAGAGAGSAMQSHGPAALHTPLTTHPPHPPHQPHQPHQPLINYHRAPRPSMVGGYYEESGTGGGYCAEYTRRAPPLAHHDVSTHSCGGSAVVSGNAGGAGGGATSEFVRNELRAVVGARSRSELHAPMQQPDMDPLTMGYDMGTPGGGSVVGGRATSATPKPWESHQSTSSTTEAGSAEAASAAGGDEARTGAGAGAGAGAGGGAEAAAGAAVAAARASSASLLQKLLSE